MTFAISLRSAAGLAILGAAICALLAMDHVDAHSRLMAPAARYGGYCKLNDDCPVCGYRDMSWAHPEKFVYKRGQTIDVNWPRNNHAGGLVRLSVVPFTMAKKYETWQDVQAGVVQFSCAESNCKSHTDDPYGPDGDGYDVEENMCSSKLTIPNHLQDGQYVLHWTWQNVGMYFGDFNKGLTSYYGCHDFTVSGGAKVERKARCPKLTLGDPHTGTKNNTCAFFGPSGKGNPSDPLWCPQDGCRGKWYYQKPTGFESC